MGLGGARTAEVCCTFVLQLGVGPAGGRQQAFWPWALNQAAHAPSTLPATVHGP